MKLDIKAIIIGILATFLVASVYTCNKQDKEVKAVITQLQFDLQTVDSISNAKGQKVTEQAVIITNNNKALQAATDSLFNLRKQDAQKIKDVIAYYKSVMYVELDTVRIPYTDTTYLEAVDSSCETTLAYFRAHTISVPRRATITTADYDATVEVKKDIVNLSLKLIDTQYVRFVHLKGGLLKKDQTGKRHFILKKKAYVQVLHTNSLINVTNQNSTLFEQPKKPLWTKGLLIGAGIVLGLLLK